MFNVKKWGIKLRRKTLYCVILFLLLNLFLLGSGHPRHLFLSIWSCNFPMNPCPSVGWLVSWSKFHNLPYPSTFSLYKCSSSKAFFRYEVILGYVCTVPLVSFYKGLVAKNIGVGAAAVKAWLCGQKKLIGTGQLSRWQKTWN